MEDEDTVDETEVSLGPNSSRRTGNQWTIMYRPIDRRPGRQVEVSQALDNNEDRPLIEFTQSSDDKSLWDAQQIVPGGQHSRARGQQD